MEGEGKILRDCLDGHSRSNMTMHLLLSYHYGLVDDPDLDEFSDDLSEHILELCRTFG